MSCLQEAGSGKVCPEHLSSFPTVPGGKAGRSVTARPLQPCKTQPSVRQPHLPSSVLGWRRHRDLEVPPKL